MAEQGFIVSPRLAQSIAGNPELADFPAARAYFFIDGAPLEAGTRVLNLAYARTLRTVAAGGADAFYHGATSPPTSPPPCGARCATRAP